MIWNQTSLNEALGVEVNFPICANHVQFNSNDVKEGDLFIALKEGQGDGHDYVMHALEKGACAVIVEQKILTLPLNRMIYVENSFAALKLMAIYKRKKSLAKFIAITGSVGKTSVKDAIKIVFGAFTANIFASRHNFNNYLGVLLNLASIPDDTKYAVFELGMSNAGEMRELTKLVMPNVAIITNISEAHLAHFQNVDEIVRAKCEIFEGLSEDGVAIINTDNDYKNLILSVLNKLSINNIYNFGSTDDTDFQLISYKNVESRVVLAYKLNNDKINITLPFIPRHCAINYTIILMVVLIFGEDLKKAIKQLSNVELTIGRGKIITIGSNQIICDYYNASPASMKASLRYLGQLSGENKVVILGDMLELGERSRQLHQDLVPYILESGCSKVFLVGSNTKYIYDLLSYKFIKRHFTKISDLMQELPALIGKNEIILVKGSRGIRLDLAINFYKKYEHAI